MFIYLIKPFERIEDILNLQALTLMSLLDAAILPSIFKLYLSKIALDRPVHVVSKYGTDFFRKLWLLHKSFGDTNILSYNKVSNLF